MDESTFSFGLSQKVNDAQPKRFVELTEELDEAGRNKFKRNTETNWTLISCELNTTLNIAEKLVWKSNFGLSKAVFEHYIKMIKMKMAMAWKD